MTLGMCPLTYPESYIDLPRVISLDLPRVIYHELPRSQEAHHIQDSQGTGPARLERGDAGHPPAAGGGGVLVWVHPVQVLHLHLVPKRARI